MAANLICCYLEKVVSAEDFRGDRYDVISQRLEVVASLGIAFQDLGAGMVLIAVVFNYELFIGPAEVRVVAPLGNGATLRSRGAQEHVADRMRKTVTAQFLGQA